MQGGGRGRLQSRAQPRKPSTLETVTSVPPAGREIMSGRKAWMVLMGPMRLTETELVVGYISRGVGFASDLASCRF